MQKRLRGETWIRQLAIAVLFGLAVAIFRHVSISHWFILGGLYLSALLLAPYRYWPALMVGEMGSMAHLSYVCAPELGISWALLNMVPTLLFIAPVAYWAREKGSIFASSRGLNMSTFLISALLMAGIMMIRSLGMITITDLPVGYPAINYGQLAARWLLGDYLGMLTITPLVVILRQELAHSSWKEVKHRLAESRFAMEVAFVLLPTLAFLVWMGLNASPSTQTRQIIQIAMFLPIVWLALRHGWHGAAVGGCAASFSILLLMPHRYDGDTIQAEILVAFVISTMLLMGARIAALDQRAESERTDLRLALSLAQRNAQLGEMQLRMTSQTLEQIGLAVHSVCMMMTNRFRLPQTAVEDRSYQHLALNAKDQLFGLADSLYPVAWQEKGLSSALREGQIPRVLDKAGIKYWCNLQSPLNRLSSTLHLAIYRLACDAIAEHCARKDIAEIGVRLRCGEHGGRQWIVVSFGFKTDPSATRSVRWDQLLPQIMPAGSGRGFHSIEDRAATFEGRARKRALPNEQRVSVLLLDPEKPENVRLH